MASPGESRSSFLVRLARSLGMKEEAAPDKHLDNNEEKSRNYSDIAKRQHIVGVTPGTSTSPFISTANHHTSVSTLESSYDCCIIQELDEHSKHTNLQGHNKHSNIKDSFGSNFIKDLNDLDHNISIDSDDSIKDKDYVLPQDVLDDSSSSDESLFNTNLIDNVQFQPQTFDNISKEPVIKENSENDFNNLSRVGLANIEREHSTIEKLEHLKSSTDVCIDAGTSSPHKKRHRDPDQWEKNKKKKKNCGESYKSASGKEVPAKEIKRPCGGKCRLKCSQRINEAQRIEVFNKFWLIGDLTRQRDFVHKNTTVIKPKYSMHNNDSKRSLNYAYYLHIHRDKIRVCKTFFMSTLAIGSSFVSTTLKKASPEGIIQEERRGRHAKRGKEVSEDVKNSVRDHIKSYPTKESHYCRAKSSKMYLDGDLNLSKMYRHYKEKCMTEGTTPAKESMYGHIFRTEFNYSFHVPKKDQCNLCASYQNCDEKDKKEMEEQYGQHLKEKVLSRQEKERDIEEARADKTKLVCCYDMEAVLQTPCGNEAQFYYKRRLNVYNCSMFDTVEKKGYCYLWDETMGDKGANEVGTCVYLFLKEWAHERDVVFYTDNCMAQNKNKYLMCLYLFCTQSSDNFVNSIVHKYLVVGHTQNEGDSIHARIEEEKKRKLKKGPIFVPATWRSVILDAKVKGHPYHVTELDYSEIIYLKDLTEQIGKNFTINTDGEKVVWNNIRKIKVDRANPYMIQYSYTYEEEGFSKKIDVRRKVRGRPSIFSASILRSAFTERRKISGAKKRDLISLCTSKVIPRVHWSYYESLKAKEDNQNEETPLDIEEDF